MKKYLLILLCALVSCVGQKEDPEDGTTPRGSTVADGRTGIVLDFTATWCVNCPRMTTAIEEASAARSFIPICVHFQDDFVCDQGKQLVSHFGVEAYPSAVMNMDKSTLITATSKDLIIAKLDASVSSKSPCTIEPSLDYEKGVLLVKVTAAEEGEYTLSAAVLDDGLVHAQTGASDKYVHNNVFCGFLQKDLLGDSLGQLSKGQSAQLGFDAGGLIKSNHIAIYVCQGGAVNSAIDFKP